MTDAELRDIVREAIARCGGLPPALADGRGAGTGPRAHASHAVFVLPAGTDRGGPCLIEPGVPCNHCGYCKSYGH